MSEQQSVASTSRPPSPVAPLPDFTSSRPYRFTWDAANRRPGPASISGTSEGRGDYFAYKPNLGQFNFSSASLTTGAIPPEWSSAKHGFNAISTLVNSPHKRSAPPKAHESVPPVLPAQLPRVRRKDFDPYLKAVAPDWEQFERNQRSSKEGTVQNEAFASGLAQIENEEPSSPRTPRAFHGTTLPPLNTIPSVFFEANFELSEPRTFAIVTEQHEGAEEQNDPASLSHSLPLLERLSHYADTIELHLIREVSIRSSSFFAALTNLNELQTESAQCLDRIRKLRGMLNEVDESGAKKGLEIIKQGQKLQNIDDVREGVKTVQNVVEMIGLARNLANGNEWEAALGVIDGINSLWDPDISNEVITNTRKPQQSGSSLPSSLSSVSESPTEERPRRKHSIPLSSLQAFSSLPENLHALTLSISESLSSEFVNILKTDLYSSLYVKADTENSENERRTSLKDRLVPLARGLCKTNRVRESFRQWRDIALTEIRASIRKHLSSFSELDEDQNAMKSSVERGSTLRSSLQIMPHSEFITLLQLIFGTFLSGIEELATQNSILSEVLNSLTSSKAEVDFPSVLEDLAEVLSSATELAHARAAKILNLRLEQHSSLSLPEFFELFSETWKFVIKTETICRRMVVGLRGTIVSQAKAFLQSSHQSRISQSAKFVEEEHWSAVDVPSSVQIQVNLIVDSAMRDPPDLVIKIDSSSSPTANGSKASSAKQLSVEDRTFFAVSATLQMLSLLLDYLRIITNLPLLTTDAVSRIIEFLKAFNSRTCQVVLGAGAMRSAGLKNITAKHLALASQSLSIVIALIPYVRECFRRHLNPKQAVMLVEFDKLKRDYQEHQQEIHSKLIAIMGDRVTTHCRTLQSVNWDVQRDGVNDYMVMLVKETVTLHKVLSRYLQSSNLEEVMSQVLAGINHNLSEEYGKIDLPSDEAKGRLLRDAQYLNTNLTALKGISAPTGMLEVVVNEKRVRHLAPPPQSPQPPTSPAPAPAPTQSPPTPQPQQSIHHSPFGSANERLRGIFHRSSSMDKKSQPPQRTASVVAAPLEKVPEKHLEKPEERRDKARQVEEKPEAPLPPTGSENEKLAIINPSPLPPLPQSPSPDISEPSRINDKLPELPHEASMVSETAVATNKVVSDDADTIVDGSEMSETLVQSPEQSVQELQAEVA